ncbi:MAG: response regulator [Verrucomicrobiales bacterium]|nr:response regulator [Verrucomicrobiales bacterium]
MNPPSDSDGTSPNPPIDALAQIRHDLRAPASNIQGYAEMLLEEAAESGNTPFLPDLERIRDAGRSLVDLIRLELAPDIVAAAPLDFRRLHADLRTPLNHVTGYCEILMEQAEASGLEGMLRDLQRIHDAALGFLRLTQELLVPSRLHTPTCPIEAVHPGSQEGALALSRMASSTGIPRPEASAMSMSGTVLLVDDDESNRALLSRRLKRLGFQVIEVGDGSAALDCLRQTPVDVILLDMLMPGMRGDEILGQIKTDPRIADLPVIMLSALDDMDSVVRCILLGAEDYLAKPFNPVLLRARIGACLEKRRLRQREQSYLAAIEKERQKSDSLLLNVLPLPIANRLKLGETTIVDSLADATILFADVVGFTELAARVSSVDLVRLLDDIFSHFDTLAEAQGLEKIKTIGDAYMVVGGLPTGRSDHAEAIADLALGMLADISQRFSSSPTPLRLRLGINTGPVIAGVIGRHKFNYDLWGDTVNMASRMESHGLPGCIQVTETTYLRLRDRYVLEPRGEIEVKGKGRMRTWFLKGRRTSPAP